MNGDTCNITVTGAQTDAGSYTATAESVDNSNYVLPEDNEKEFVINQRELTLVWDTDKFAHDFENHVPTATTADVLEGDTCNIIVTGEQSDMGDFTATATIDNPNYVVVNPTQCYVIRYRCPACEWFEEKLEKYEDCKFMTWIVTALHRIFHIIHQHLHIYIPVVREFFKNLFKK